MATIQVLNYSVPPGASLRAGTFDAGVFGSIALTDVAVSGLFSSNQSAVVGSITLDNVVATGGLTIQPSVRVALMGDSLTTHLLGYNWSPIFWWNGLLGGKLQVVANAGVAGDTVANMLSRVDNSYATGGLAGLSPLGFIQFRGGTNDARNNTSITSLATTYTSLLNNLKSKCEGPVIILSVPPIGPTEANFATANSRTQEYNTWLQNFAATNSGFIYVDDSANLRDGAGAQLSGYFNSDGIHNDGRATWRQGVDAAAILAPYINAYNYPSPVSTSAADVYPTQPQWVPNHLMSGGGSVATGWSIGGYGSGFTQTTSIVAADAGDSNQTPWQRVAPTAVGYTGSGEALLITSALNGRTVTASDPTSWDIIVEIRFNAFDTRPFKWSRIMVFSVGSSQPISYDLDLKLGGEASITHSSVVCRHKMPRMTFNNEASGISLRWEWATRFAYTGSMGSFDFRCFTVRG